MLTDPGLVGTFINEQDVAAAVGVSRTPVREALLRLAAEDLVQLRPNRGRLPGSRQRRADAPDHAGARGDRDVGGAPLHGGRHRSRSPRWRTGCASRRRWPSTGPDEEFARVDGEFHLLLVRAAGNPLLERMYDALHARHVLLGLTAARRHGLQRETVVHEHRTILAALRSGDADAAERAIWEHLAADGAGAHRRGPSRGRRGRLAA